MKPTVSVVIPAYNYARFLGEAIESALKQTLPPLEVIVVDDGSTDNTAEVLARYGDRVRVLRQKNQGVSVAANHGAEMARGDLLAFLDADDIWLPRKLELQVQRFFANPDLGLVHCGVADINTDGKVLRQYLNGLEGWVATEMLLFRRATILGGGSGAVIQRSTFQAVGGFDPCISVSQDWDLHYRVARQQQVGFVPEVLLHYRVHGANRHRYVRKMEHDMLLAYEKAFHEAGPELRRLRQRCYGNLHTVLAGSFLTVGDYWKIPSHAVKGLLMAPHNFSQIIGFPLRWLGRRRFKNNVAATGGNGEQQAIQ